MKPLHIPLNTYKIGSPFEGVVRSNIRLTHALSPNDTRHVVMDLAGSRYDYLEGQSAGVLPPGCDEKGRPHSVRLYSIASHRSGEEAYGKSLALCVKRVAYMDAATGLERRGVASNYLCDTKPGDRVRLTGPAGSRFILPDEVRERDFIFIATGTGIAPYRGMLRELFLRDVQGKVWLIFGVPYRSDILYESEFTAYETHRNFRWVTAVSREEKNPDGSKVYVQHRVAQYCDELAALALKPGTLIYICGIKGMEKEIIQVFEFMLGPNAFSLVRKRMLMEVY